MQYEIPITSGLKIMAKVKVFVQAAQADTNARATCMKLASKT